MRRREIGAGKPHDLFAKLVAQYAGRNFFDGALGEFAELERTERDANKPRHREVEMVEHVAHFAVFAFTDGQREPDIRALHAIEHSLDWTVMDARNRHAVANAVKFVLRDRAMRSHPVSAQPSGRRQFQKPRQRAVISQKQKPLGVEIEPTDADQAR